MDYRRSFFTIITVTFLILMIYNNNTLDFVDDINRTWLQIQSKKLFNTSLKTVRLENVTKNEHVIFGEKSNASSESTERRRGDKKHRTVTDLETIDESTNVGSEKVSLISRHSQQSREPESSSKSDLKQTIKPNTTTTKRPTIDSEELIYESKKSGLPAVINSTTITNVTKEYYATFSWNPSMGLGNSMFVYASIYGIARKNNKTLVINDPKFSLNQVFNITKRQMNTSSLELYTRGFGLCCKYSDTFDALPKNKHVSIGGYLQSYKYFIDYEKEIRREFTYLPKVREPCSKTINEIMQKASNITNISKTKPCLLVGAHMRRGDFVQENKQTFGHHPASKEFMHAAIDHFRTKFQRHCLLFVVLGNDYKWNSENAPEARDVLVLKPQSAGVDMCILSNCDHNIVSAGSYGWWAAWLANGYTVYEKVQARTGSSLAKEFNDNYTDYIPQKWVPI